MYVKFETIDSWRSHKYFKTETVKRALMVVPAIAAKDPSKLIEVPMKVKDTVFKK